MRFSLENRGLKKRISAVGKNIKNKKNIENNIKR